MFDVMYRKTNKIYLDNDFNLLIFPGVFGDPAPEWTKPRKTLKTVKKWNSS